MMDTSSLLQIAWNRQEIERGSKALFANDDVLPDEPGRARRFTQHLLNVVRSIVTSRVFRITSIISPTDPDTLPSDGQTASLL
jgi:hypothetical protein